MAKLPEYYAAYGVELFFIQVGVEVFVKVINRSDGLDCKRTILTKLDMGFFIKVVFVLNLTNYLFKHIFNGDQAGGAAILVNHDGHVIAVFLEFLEQLIKALALGHECEWPKDFTYMIPVEIIAQCQWQQVFGQEYANNVIRAVTNNRKATVGG